MLTRIALPRAERTIPQKSGSARVQSATLSGSLSLDAANDFLRCRPRSRRRGRERLDGHSGTRTQFERASAWSMSALPVGTSLANCS